jgi:HEAT repeat protein
MVPLVSLIDDHNIATRSYTLTILQYVGSLKYEQLKTLAPALLTRLDDPGNEVREKAAKCLGKLELAAHEDDAQDLWESLLKQILATMLIHLESPEINIRDTLIESIGCLKNKCPKVYETALGESTISQELKRKLP